MKGALVTFIAKVEGVAKEKFSGAPISCMSSSLMKVLKCSYLSLLSRSLPICYTSLMQILLKSYQFVNF